MVGSANSSYKILEDPGEGGMGIVVKAHDTELNRAVARRFLSAGLHTHEPEGARMRLARSTSKQ